MNFDRVADIYDATRGFPEGVADQIADGIIAATGATPHSRFLELGIGTGRIAEPFVRRGYNYTGVDISPRMLERLRRKLAGAPNLTLIEDDITRVTLPEHSYDIAILVHVLHLIPEWQDVLRSLLDALTPKGAIVVGNDRPQAGDPAQSIRRQWRHMIRETGTQLDPDYGDWDSTEQWLTSQGGWISMYRVAQWTRSLRPIDLIEGLHGRAYSHTWSMSDEVLDAVNERILIWARQQFGDLEQHLSSHWEFEIAVTRFPEEPLSQHEAESRLEEASGS